MNAVNIPAEFCFELVVIGGGPAGISGAVAAGILGKRVALIEKEAIVGGAGVNTGTIPSKTLRETALVLSGGRSRRLFGVDLSLRREATIADFMCHAAGDTGTQADLDRAYWASDHEATAADEFAGVFHQYDV